MTTQELEEKYGFITVPGAGEKRKIRKIFIVFSCLFVFMFSLFLFTSSLSPFAIVAFVLLGAFMIYLYKIYILSAINKEIDHVRGLAGCAYKSGSKLVIIDKQGNFDLISVEAELPEGPIIKYLGEKGAKGVAIFTESHRDFFEQKINELQEELQEKDEKITEKINHYQNLLMQDI